MKHYTHTARALRRYHFARVRKIRSFLEEHLRKERQARRVPLVNPDYGNARHYYGPTRDEMSHALLWQRGDY